jgi:acyl-CoA thioester hydrolase
MRTTNHSNGENKGPSQTVSVAGATPAVVKHTTQLRVRYSETDQMGTFYNSRALEWFECGRTELLRSIGLTYREMEGRGLFLPLVEAHVEYLGRAQYDDLLLLTTSLRFVGRARVQLHVEIVNAQTGQSVARGYTIHAFTNREGRAIRPPDWFPARTSANDLPRNQEPR